MKWNVVISALVIGVGLCNQSHGFEWLDRLIGIDLDNSEAQSNYYGYSAGYAPYGTGYAAPAYTAGYSPYAAGYPAAASYGCSNCTPMYGAPQTGYYTQYQQPVTSYYPAGTYSAYGNQRTNMQSYPMQANPWSYGGNQPVFAPATTYAPAGSAYWSGN